MRFPVQIGEDKFEPVGGVFLPEETFLLVLGPKEAEGERREGDLGSECVLEALLEVLVDSLGVFLHMGQVVVCEHFVFLLIHALVDVVADVEIYHTDVGYHAVDFEEGVLRRL